MTCLGANDGRTIQRMGAVKLVICTASVPISAAPLPAWRTAFLEAIRMRPGAAGRTVRIEDAEIVFTCEASHVDAVVADIDAWIQAANAATRSTASRDRCLTPTSLSVSL